GTNGIGRGLVDYFVGQGVKVIALGSREETVRRLKEEYEARNESIDSRVLDVRRVPDIAPVFEKIRDDYGRIDILVNCAGMGHPIPAIQVTEEDWDTMMDLNLKGAFFCAQAAARVMLPAHRGHIINITSQISVVANEGEAVYCASKGGLNQLTRVMALEWGKEGILVNAVAPTFTYTPGTAERLDQPEFRASVLSRIPRGELGTIDDVASAVHYLASDHANMASGTILFIDGGWTSV
ncbi:MAG: SDR family oxidoreductase, partial [Bacteroidales bacterium]|nr:SDR family oxidoreductase [Bacteroidales bacterium]